MKYYLEAKKFIDYRGIIIAVLILIINIINVNKYINMHVYFDDKQYCDVRSELYHQLEGDMDESKIKYIEKKKNELEPIVDSRSYSTEYDDSTLTGYLVSDYNLYCEIDDQLKYNKDYKNYASKLSNHIKENYDFFSSKNNKEESKKYKYLLEKYKNREIGSISDFKNTSYFLGIEETDFFIFIVLMILISPVFSNDREKKIANIILTTKNGKHKSCFLKLRLVVFMTVVISTIFYLSNFIIYYFRARMYGLNKPLYYISEFRDTAFSGSVLQFIIWTTLLKILAYTAMAMMIALASSVSMNNIYAITVASIIMVGNFVISQKTNLFGFNKLFEVKELMKRYWCENIFGMEMHGVYVGVISSIIVIVFAMILIVLFECNINKIIKRERI